MVRKHFLEGKGVNSSYAIFQDATGKAKDKCIALGMAIIHVFQGWDLIVIVVVANIWFFCLFYILYLPIKVKKAREKKEKEKKK